MPFGDKPPREVTAEDQVRNLCDLINLLDYLVLLFIQREW